MFANRTARWLVTILSPSRKGADVHDAADPCFSHHKPLDSGALGMSEPHRVMMSAVSSCSRDGAVRECVGHCRTEHHLVLAVREVIEIFMRRGLASFLS